MAKGGNGGSTIDYGQSLTEFENGDFKKWQSSCSTLKSECEDIPEYSNAGNVKGKTLNDFLKDAKAKGGSLSTRLDKLDNPPAFTAKQSFSIKIVDGSVTGVSCSFTGSSFAAKWLEFSLCGFFLPLSGVSAFNVVSNFKYKTKGGVLDGFITILSGGARRKELNNANVRVQKIKAVVNASRNAPCMSEMGVLMHF